MWAICVCNGFARGPGRQHKRPPAGRPCIQQHGGRPPSVPGPKAGHRVVGHGVPGLLCSVPGGLAGAAPGARARRRRARPSGRPGHRAPGRRGLQRGPAASRVRGGPPHNPRSACCPTRGTPVVRACGRRHITLASRQRAALCRAACRAVVPWPAGACTRAVQQPLRARQGGCMRPPMQSRTPTGRALTHARARTHARAPHRPSTRRPARRSWPARRRRRAR